MTKLICKKKGEKCPREQAFKRKGIFVKFGRTEKIHSWVEKSSFQGGARAIPKKVGVGRGWEGRLESVFRGVRRKWGKLPIAEDLRKSTQARGQRSKRIGKKEYRADDAKKERL